MDNHLYIVINYVLLKSLEEPGLSLMLCWYTIPLRDEVKFQAVIKGNSGHYSHLDCVYRRVILA